MSFLPHFHHAALYHFPEWIFSGSSSVECVHSNDAMVDDDMMAISGRREFLTGEVAIVFLLGLAFQLGKSYDNWSI